jgi:hypothetical protein
LLAHKPGQDPIAPMFALYVSTSQSTQVPALLPPQPRRYWPAGQSAEHKLGQDPTAPALALYVPEAQPWQVPLLLPEQPLRY